jgi:hypothetical protein
MCTDPDEPGVTVMPPESVMTSRSTGPETESERSKEPSFWAARTLELRTASASPSRVSFMGFPFLYSGTKKRRVVFHGACATAWRGFGLLRLISASPEWSIARTTPPQTAASRCLPPLTANS